MSFPVPPSTPASQCLIFGGLIMKKPLKSQRRGHCGCLSCPPSGGETPLSKRARADHGVHHSRLIQPSQTATSAGRHNTIHVETGAQQSVWLMWCAVGDGPHSLAILKLVCLGSVLGGRQGTSVPLPSCRHGAAAALLTSSPSQPLRKGPV